MPRNRIATSGQATPDPWTTIDCRRVAHGPSPVSEQRLVMGLELLLQLEALLLGEPRLFGGLGAGLLPLLGGREGRVEGSVGGAQCVASASC